MRAWLTTKCRCVRTDLAVPDPPPPWIEIAMYDAKWRAGDLAYPGKPLYLDIATRRFNLEDTPWIAGNRTALYQET